MPDIIVVEDNSEIGNLLCDFLRKENYTVSLAESGKKALDLYDKYGAKLMVLDIMLPGEIDGFTVCSKIREDSNTVRRQTRRASSKALTWARMITSRSPTISTFSLRR